MDGELSKMTKFDDYQPIERELVYIKYAKCFGIAVSKKIIVEKPLYYILVDTSYLLAWDYEIDFLE